MLSYSCTSGEKHRYKIQRFQRGLLYFIFFRTHSRQMRSIIPIKPVSQALRLTHLVPELKSIMSGMCLVTLLTW